MTTVLQFAVIGTATGAVYALLAQGVVLIHRASGIVNFSQGPFAVIAGFFFSSLTQVNGWGVWPAFALVCLGAAVASVIVYWVAIRPLRNASQLTQLIATIAVLLIAEALATLHWSSNIDIVPAFLSTTVAHVGAVVISVGQIILVAIACGLTFVLWAMTRVSLVGLAIRGVAENPRATAALGWSPNVLASGAWALAGALGAAAGMLIAPVTGVQVDNMTLLLVVTLAAALVGGFSSFPLALAGAIGIGIIQAEASNYVSLQGFPDALPFVVIVVFLAVRGRGMPQRGHIVERAAELGSGRVNLRVVLPAVAVLGVLIVTVFSPALDQALTASMAFAVIMLSIVVLTGYCGQLSLAQLCFGGIAAVVSGRLVESASFGFLPALIVGVLATIPIGLLFAIPALRTRGMTLAIVTLGLGSAVSAVIFANASIIGGIEGTPVASQTLLGWNIDPSVHPERFTLLTLVVFVLCALLVSSVRRGRVGRRLIAVRSNERAASALGISTYATKLYAFGLSAAIAGLGGILLGFQFDTIPYSSYDPFTSLLAASYAVIGGVGYVAGTVLAAMLAAGGLGNWVLNLFGTNLQTYVPLIGGIGLLMTLLQNPNGLASNAARLADLIRRRVRPASIATVEPLPAVSAHRVKPASLSVSDLVVRFGGVTAVKGVSLSLEPGRVSGLIGPNGAGKTTVIDAMTGFVRSAGGTISLDGAPIDGWATYRRARAGISRSFQSLELFEGVTVRENLLAACERRDAKAYLTNLVLARPRPFPAAAVAAIREFGLEADLDRNPAELSFGRRRLLGIARAVAPEPSVLLLDEPGAGLDENETKEMAALVRRLATNWGIAILLVEHDMSFVMSVCDDITVIDFGQQIAHGAPEQVRQSEAVIAAYLGSPVEDTAQALTHSASAPEAEVAPTRAPASGGGATV